MSIKERENKNIGVGSYDYSGLAHWWIYNYGFRSTAGGRMSVTGNYVSSYNTPIAVMMEPMKKKHGPAVFITDIDYSNTTKKHKWAVESAASHLPVMHVIELDFHDDDWPLSTHCKNIEWFKKKYNKYALKALRARKNSSFTRWKRLAEDTLLESAYYFKYFKLGRHKECRRFKSFFKKEMGTSITEASKEFIEKIKSQFPEDRYLAASTSSKKKREHNKKYLQKWLNGEDVKLYTDVMEEKRVRYRNGKIEATSGLYVKADTAVMAYNAIGLGKIKPGANIGGYVYGGFSSRKLKIGCHSLPLDDVRKAVMDAAKDLGLKVIKFDPFYKTGEPKSSEAGDAGSISDLEKSIDDDIKGLAELAKSGPFGVGW